MAFERDPVSELWDAAARQLLERAYARPGAWAGTRLVPPGPRTVAWAAGLGINLAGPDPAAGRAARGRWERAFLRALHYQHGWWWNGRGGPSAGWRSGKRLARVGRPLAAEVGRYQAALGVLPAGRAVRVRLAPGGAAAARAVAGLPVSARIYDAAGNPAGRWADPARRDW